MGKLFPCGRNAFMSACILVEHSSERLKREQKAFIRTVTSSTQIVLPSNNRAEILWAVISFISGEISESDTEALVSWEIPQSETAALISGEKTRSETEGLSEREFSEDGVKFSRGESNTFSAAAWESSDVRSELVVSN